MKNYYCKVPEWSAVFKVNEGCCYEKIVYKGKEIGVVGKMDKLDEMNWKLLCRICIPGLEITEISEQEYSAIYEDVNRRRLAPEA